VDRDLFLGKRLFLRFGSFPLANVLNCHCMFVLKSLPSLKPRNIWKVVQNMESFVNASLLNLLNTYSIRSSKLYSGYRQTTINIYQKCCVGSAQRKEVVTKFCELFCQHLPTIVNAYKIETFKIK